MNVITMNETICDLLREHAKVRADMSALHKLLRLYHNAGEVPAALAPAVRAVLGIDGIEAPPAAPAQPAPAPPAEPEAAAQPSQKRGETAAPEPVPVVPPTTSLPLATAAVSQPLPAALPFKPDHKPVEIGTVPPRAAPGTMWTPPRDALLMKEWPAGRPTPEIHIDLNKMIGVYVPIDRVAQRAAQLGVRRPPGFMATVKAKAQQPVREVPIPPKRTDARVKLVGEEYQAGMEIKQILLRVNAMAGAPCTENDILAWVAANGWRRPAVPMAGFQRR